MKTYKDIQGWYDWHPLAERIVRNFFPNRGTYVEVGVWKGKSLVAFAALCQRYGKNPTIHGIDLFGGVQDDSSMDRMVASSGGSFFGETQKNLIDANVFAELIRGDSVQSAGRFEDGSIDCILIDALHTYKAVRDDTAAWKPKLKKGGMMLWHDCDREEVRRAVRESWGPHFKIEQPRTGHAVKQ